MSILTAKCDPSYIHIRIEPTPAIDVPTRDLMHEITALVRERLGDTAQVKGLATLSPTYREHAG